ncbi:MULTISPECIES: hypothetical protein [Vibrio]|uniref:hypothetical protein n=1 Tax=Vibrio TaxID=662 RepID=UPI00078BF526|nr:MULTISPECIES: hypothetical protein [Vibrio]BAU70944.1 hypothetical protein [Vibrio sp. 04Ya108]BBM67798.1 hypothetical protein VA249_44440 [Vibrio alfacsensis]BCN26969.1 hypothetical protein VYA_41610 [Vibrio alfacsensis]
MQVTTQHKKEYSVSSYRPSIAYVVHKSSQHDLSNIVTTHEITEQGELLAGTVMRGSHFDALKRSVPSGGNQLLSENVLVSNQTLIAFYVPSQSRLIRLLDHNHQLGYRQFLLPMPAHILYAKSAKGGFTLGGYAVKENKRSQITASTKLFYSPTFNVYQANGRLCLGSVNVNRDLDVRNIEHWTEAFFCSVGTSLKFNVIEKIGNEDIQAKILGLNHKAHFPKRWLLDSKVTLGSFLTFNED